MPPRSACHPPTTSPPRSSLAILGGYQNRTHDPPPGHQIMWRYERISNATIGYRIAQRERIVQRIVGTGQALPYTRIQGTNRRVCHGMEHQNQILQTLRAPECKLALSGLWRTRR